MMEARATIWLPHPAVELDFQGGNAWLVSISGARRFVRDYYPLLDETERARLADISSPARAEAYLIGHGLLRQVMSLKTRGIVPAAEWRLHVSTTGKPSFQAPAVGQPFAISIAHCAEAIALAVALRADAGIDVEECVVSSPLLGRGIDHWRLTALEKHRRTRHSSTLVAAFGKCGSVTLSLRRPRAGQSAFAVMCDGAIARHRSRGVFQIRL